MVTELTDAQVRALGIKASTLALVGERLYARRSGRWELLDDRSYGTIDEMVGRGDGRARVTLRESDGSAKS